MYTGVKKKQWILLRGLRLCIYLMASRLVENGDVDKLMIRSENAEDAKEARSSELNQLDRDVDLWPVSTPTVQP